MNDRFYYRGVDLTQPDKSYEVTMQSFSKVGVGLCMVYIPFHIKTKQYIIL